MHSQVLVIYPYGTKLEDIMYWYQEVDKTQNEKISDDRCQFFLTVPEDEIPTILNEIEKHLKKHRDEHLEKLHYRTEHSFEETKEKYKFIDGCFNSYVNYQKWLCEFEQIKNLEYDNPKHIKFVKDFGFFSTDKWIDIYIKDVGYGTFHNPYELWDFYHIVNEYRFLSNTYFLISKNGEKNNTLILDWLDVEKTVNNIHELTRVWEHIIFCEENPRESLLYTIDDIRFDKEWNEHCLLENILGSDGSLKDVLLKLQDEYKGRDYVVTALDFHW